MNRALQHTRSALKQPKHYLCLLLFSILLFQSCTHEHELYANNSVYNLNAPIHFTTHAKNSVEVKTRGIVTSSTDLDGENTVIFGVGFEKGQSPAWVTSEKMMNSLIGTLKKNASGTYDVEYSTRYYLAGERWLHSFRLIYPVHINEGVTIGAAEFTEKPYILVDLTKQPDVMIASADNIEKRTTAIHLQFKHLLSQVSFTIRTDANSTEQLYLKKLDVSGRMQARIDFPGTQLTPDGYGLDDEEINIFNIGNGSFHITTNKKDVCNSLFFPKANTESRAYLFTLTVSDGKEYTFRLPEVNEVWEPGKRYLYHLKINSKTEQLEITTDPDIDSWIWDGSVYVPN